MIEVKRGALLAMLLVAMSCTVGETPPEPPAPGEEPVAAEPAAAERPEAEAPPADAEAVAADLLARARVAYEAGEMENALMLARQVLRDYAGTSSAEPARWLAARSAFALEEYEEAQRLSESYADTDPGEAAEQEAEALAELAEDARAAAAPAKVGVVLPRSGSRILMRYADWLLEGIQIAVREAEQRQGREIELVVADDAGGAAEAVRGLERQGALAIVGPMLPEELAAAAGARVNGEIVMVSPTVPEPPTDLPETFSVNGGDTRGAQELGAYAAAAGLRQAALLYPRTPEYERKARAFAAEYEARGGDVRATVPYDSGTTTFADHMRAILAAVSPSGGLLRGEELPTTTAPDSAGLEQPDAGAPAGPGAFALFVDAPDRDVRQIAPQVAFYGLDSAGVQVLGDAAWASAEVRRMVPARDLEGVVAASHFPPDRADAAADPAFIRLYESTYRRSLANQLPALGYDAANLVLQALPNRMLTPGAVARRFGLLTGIHGATGILSVRADRVIRTPYLVQIRNGELVPAPPPAELGLTAAKPAAVQDGGGKHP